VFLSISPVEMAQLQDKALGAFIMGTDLLMEGVVRSQKCGSAVVPFERKEGERKVKIVLEVLNHFSEKLCRLLKKSWVFA